METITNDKKIYSIEDIISATVENLSNAKGALLFFKDELLRNAKAGKELSEILTHCIQEETKINQLEYYLYGLKFVGREYYEGPKGERNFIDK